MTINEIRNMLKDMGIAYPDKAKKDELQQLLNDALAKAKKCNTAAKEVEPETETVEIETEAPEATEVETVETSNDVPPAVVLYKVTVTSDRLNIRKTPDQKEDNVDHVALKGEELNIAEEIGEWLKTTDGLYVMAKYVLKEYNK